MAVRKQRTPGDEYGDLLEVAAEEQDEELRKALKESVAQIKRGEVSNFEALRAIYKRR